MIDSNELTQLWRRLAPSLRLLARTRGDWADDCVQEAFIRLAKEHPNPRDPAAWLVRVVRNLAIDKSRSELRRKERERRRMEQTTEWFVQNTEASADFDEGELQVALARLPELEREIVVAHVWGGLSFRQIADAFETPSSTVHRKYAEAIVELRNQLSQSLNRAK